MAATGEGRDRAYPASGTVSVPQSALDRDWPHRGSGGNDSICAGWVRRALPRVCGER